MNAIKLSRILSDLPRTLATEFSVDSTVGELLLSIVEALPVDGAAVTFVPSAASITAGDVGDGDDVAVVVLSIPLRERGTQLGAMKLFRVGGGGFDAATMASARAFADVAVAYLVVSQARVDLAEHSRQARRRPRDDGQTARALRSSEEQKTAILTSAIDAVITIDHRGRIVEFNPAAEAMFGRTEEQVDASDLARLVQPPDGLGVRWTGLADCAAPLRGMLEHSFELVASRRDGSTFPVEVTITAVDGRGPAMFVALIRDLTQRDADDAERKRLETRVHQAERLESLGELAGVVAHDFNNLLTVVLNYASAIADTETNDAETRRCATEIVSASEQASRLTRQLLQFARREPMRTEPLRIDELVDDMRGLLDSAVGERVELVVRHPIGIPVFVGDRGQTEQLLMNLAVNARDAMSEGGRFTIETSLVEHANARFVQLIVSDTGTGMSKDVMSHAFDPFFTTKSLGGGSGLGLSTVYGIVADASGEIGVVSNPGQGTTFTITLPAVAPNAPRRSAWPSADGGPPPDAVTGHGSTILVVEDQDAVRAITVAMLSRNGYRVLEAHGANAALVIAETENFDLLLTDVVMPGLTGRQLVEQLRQRGLAGRVLFMSGYSSDVFRSRRELDTSEAIIHKPFKEATLLAAVTAALAGRALPEATALV